MSDPIMSDPIYREEALRRYRDPAGRESDPLVIHRLWFLLLWGLVALLAAAMAGLALLSPELTDAVTAGASVFGGRP